MNNSSLGSETAAVIKGMLARGDRPAYIADSCGVSEAFVMAIRAGAYHTWVAPAPAHALPRPETVVRTVHTAARGQTPIDRRDRR
jgi:hypothetical protein